MQKLRNGAEITKADSARFWQALRGRVNRLLAFVAPEWQEGGPDSADVATLLKNQPKRVPLAAKKPQLACRNAGKTLISGSMADFDDNAD
jgi:hypothetical protein